MGITLIAALLLGATSSEPVFDYDRPFVYNSAGTLKKDDLLFPLVIGYPSPQMIRRNFAFGLTDKITVESSLLLNIRLITNLRLKMRMVNSPSFIMSLAPELVYNPDLNGGDDDYTLLGISLPMTVKMDRGSFLSLTPGYRRAMKGVTDMSQIQAENVLRFGVNQPWIDIDYLSVIDDRSAVALNVHFTIPVGAGTLLSDGRGELGPYTTFTGKMEYLRGVGKSTRIGLAILYNPLWLPEGFDAPENSTKADFLPQLSIWWKLPTGKSKAKKGLLKGGKVPTFRRAKTNGLTGKLKMAPVALPIPAAPAPVAAPVVAPVVAPVAPTPEPAPAPVGPDDK
jgi:hypothetical protein